MPLLSELPPPTLDTVFALQLARIHSQLYPNYIVHSSGPRRPSLADVERRPARLEPES